ncbi:MAG: M50 family metallopeptidase, partial [Myxococcota bacterium]|nr:M50 family metallopeptidase [Myxococcota bacterium]
MTLFKVRGIPIRLHSSFLVLGGLYLVLRGMNAGADAAIIALVHAVLVFAFVFLHELGHAGAAAAFGIRTHHITLYPFGGAAAMQVDPGKPRIETWIALAGPMVNGLLAAILFPLAWAGVPGTLTAAWINLGLGLFNLIPAYPMDGGRILRARLVLRHGVRTGTLRALGVARFIGWLSVAVGLYTD